MINETPNTVTDASPVLDGLILGSQLGLLLSVGYALIIVVAEAVRLVWLTCDILGFAFVVLPFTAGLPFVLIVLVLALILGALTGALIGKLWMTVRHRISRQIFTWIGSATCAVIIVLLHVVFEVRPEWGIPEWSGGELPSFGLLEAYASMVGVPSIFYVIAGAWGSGQLSRQIGK
jgi:hypothetical protein